MRQFLTLVIAVHWSAAFALLAGLAALDAETGSRAVLTYLGGAAGLPADMVGSTGLSLAFALVATLFLWVFVAAAVDRDGSDHSTEEVARMAVISGSMVVALLALTSFADTSAAFFPALAAVFASLLCSLMAVVAERRKALSEEEITAAIRLMAVGAANRAMLSRLSGRQAQSPAMTGAA
jgi:hypothetical protein